MPAVPRLTMVRPQVTVLRPSITMIARHAPEQVAQRLRGAALQAMRKRIGNRDGWLCQCPECQASGQPLQINLATLQVDHCIPLYAGGTNDPSNLRALHTNCHARITAAQAAERSARRAAEVDRLIGDPRSLGGEVHR